MYLLFQGIGLCSQFVRTRNILGAYHHLAFSFTAFAAGQPGFEFSTHVQTGGLQGTR